MIEIMTAVEDRERRVMQAVHELTGRLRLEVSPRILKDSNNTIVHLAPLRLVAKVATSHFRDASLEALDRELDVARHLATKNAPIVHPSAGVPPGPHQAAGLVVTLWRFYEDLGPARGRWRVRAIPRSSPRGPPRLPGPPSPHSRLNSTMSGGFSRTGPS